MTVGRPRRDLQEGLFIEARCELSALPGWKAVWVQETISCGGCAFLAQVPGASDSSLLIPQSLAFLLPFSPSLSCYLRAECLCFLPNSYVEALIPRCWCLEGGGVEEGGL